jgi:hypothetical protein
MFPDNQQQPPEASVTSPPPIPSQPAAPQAPPAPQQAPVINPEETYGTKLGGILQYIRIAAILGGIGMIIWAPFILLGSGLLALIGFSASVFGYAGTAISSIIQSISLVVLLVFATIMSFRIAGQIKNRNYKIYDTYIITMIVYFVYNVVHAFLSMTYYFSDFGYYASKAIPSFIWNLVWAIIPVIIYILVWTAYFSKSKRVFAWFNTRPVQASRFYGIISKLPNFIINDKTPDFSGGTPPPPPVNPLVQPQPPTANQPTPTVADNATQAPGPQPPTNTPVV